MAANDTLCFADFDPVTGAPTIDGNVQPDLGVSTAEAIESGYVNGSRMTMGGAGLPPVAVQCVKSGNNLVLGIFCRGDFSFDGGGTIAGGDVLVLALRPSQAVADQTTARRLDIFPVWEGIGAEEQQAGDPASPGNTPDDVPAFAVRTNHHARRIDFYKGVNGAVPWATASASGISGLAVKVRSWLPPIAAQTVTVGAQTSNAATLNVASTVSFPGSGQLVAASRLIAYTGKTATSFTGCSCRDAQALPDATPVASAECAWSIEVQLPISGGGADWITLDDGFGLYFDIIRLGRSAPSGTSPSQGWYSTQFRFPADVAANTLTGLLDTTTQIDPSWYGTGLIPALQEGGINRGQGVFFTNDALGVGRRLAGSGSSTLGHLIYGPGPAPMPLPADYGDNELVALLGNSGPAAAGVTATTRIANWGLGPAGFGNWALPVGMGNNPTPPQTIAAGSTAAPATATTVSTWLRANVPAALGGAAHQCIWVQLDSASPVNFVQSSVRRNMDFVGFSAVDRDAEISGVGYPPPGVGVEHDFILFTRARRIVLPRLDRRTLAAHGLAAFAAAVPSAAAGGTTGGGSGTPDVIYLWITEGYRRTGKTLRIGNVDTEVLDEAPGAFGYIGQHRGADDGLAWEFSGPGLHGSGNVHHLKVPHGGKVVIRTRVRTVPPQPPIVLPPAPAGSIWAFWLWLLVLLIVLVIVFRLLK